MKLFRKQKPIKENRQMDALATRIADGIISRQTKIADYLNRKTAYWNKASKLLLLILLCLLFGTISLYLFIKAFK